jgi:Tfp pilus assembly protein PilN
VRAVNLIPADSARGGGLAGRSFGPAHAVILALVVALGFVTIYVLTSNTISADTAKLATLRAQTVQVSAQAATLTKYTQFEQLAQARAQTVRSIAASRFDWFSALADLARVVPATTSLQTLVGTVSAGPAAGGTTSGSAASGLRSYSPGPAFELTGCTSTQDDVARLMSRLRLINGVTRVTLGDTAKSDSAAPTTSSSASPTSTVGCGANAPTFDMLVFFQPIAGGSAQGAATAAPQTGAPSTTATTPSATATTPGTTPTAPTTTTTTPATSTAPPTATTAAPSGAAR